MTGRETDVRHYVPSEKGRARQGTFLDANCAVAWLQRKKPRNWRDKVALIEKLAGGGKVKAADSDGAWCETSAGRVHGVKGMCETLAEFRHRESRRKKTATKSAKKRKREPSTERESTLPSKVAKVIARRVKKNDSRVVELTKEIASSVMAPSSARATTATATTDDKDGAKFRLTVNDALKKRRDVYYCDDWIATMQRLKFAIDHAMPAHLPRTGELTLYPLLVCDPRHVNGTPVNVTVSTLR